MTSLFGSSSANINEHTQQEIKEKEEVTKSSTRNKSSSESRMNLIRSFSELGICDWLLHSVLVMGFKRPTSIQSACMGAILEGKDVIGCAPTGSGKTAAFALPILHKLSMDPYGVYCVVISPTRELAMQINEQFCALGAPMCLKTTLVIGGVNMMIQGQQLAKKPHIVIATPGRLRHHLEACDPPDFRRVKYLVLDEADRLLAQGFAAELRTILSSMSSKRQTLIFSATLTDSIEEIQKITEKDTLQFDLTSDQKLPESLSQEYFFVPPQVKTCYLVGFLQKIFEGQTNLTKTDGKNKVKKEKRSKKKESLDFDELFEDQETKAKEFSVIIFVSTCKRCQEIQEILTHMHIDCVGLHSMLSQNRRIASLARFKSLNCPILVATDVASRGLDIPSVEVVINFDCPKVVSDYVHRVGRTARAGKSGRSVTLVTPQGPLLHLH